VFRCSVQPECTEVAQWSDPLVALAFSNRPRVERPGRGISVTTVMGGHSRLHRAGTGTVTGTAASGMLSELCQCPAGGVRMVALSGHLWL
jgi:hypothetical protein